jgi:hypothetical protein
MSRASEAQHVAVPEALVVTVLKLREAEVGGMTGKAPGWSVVDEENGSAVVREPSKSRTTTAVTFDLAGSDAIRRDD